MMMLARFIKFCIPPNLLSCWVKLYDYMEAARKQPYPAPPEDPPHLHRDSATTTKTLICPGWETAVVPVSQPGTPVRDKRGCPFVPGVATGTKEDLLSRLVTPTGTKGAASPRGWRTLLSRLVLPGTKGLFFFMFFFSQFFFYFNYTFAFQLNLCIGIQCVWSPLIYIYIYSYLYNICPR